MIHFLDLTISLNVWLLGAKEFSFLKILLNDRNFCVNLNSNNEQNTSEINEFTVNSEQTKINWNLFEIFRGCMRYRSL